MFFDGWSGLARVVVVGGAAYVALVAVLRTSGKRTLGKLNAFDLVVTVALGSTLATIILSADVALAEGVAALLLLAGAQFVVAWLSVRLAAVRRVVKSEPALLLRRGRLLDDALVRQRVAEAEVRQAVRASGVGDLEEVEAVVLETDGTLSVITRAKAGSGSALVDVDWRR